MSPLYFLVGSPYLVATDPPRPPLSPETNMNKKLKLNIDALRIEQFQVEPTVAAIRGTVRGFDPVVNETDSTCWASMYAGSGPCADCPYMPITYTCE